MASGTPKSTRVDTLSRLFESAVGHTGHFTTPRARELGLAAAIGGPMNVTLKVNCAVVGQGQVPAAMSLHFTSNATFDLGRDLDSPVSLDYYDQAPFAFNGTIGTTKISYLKK